MFKINYTLLPVKAHYFFLLAAMGPILPFIPVFGKQLGVSEIVMGSINAVLPLLFLLIKPFFGFIIDYFHKKRKIIFIFVLIATSVFYFLMVFIPNPVVIKETLCESLHSCNNSETETIKCIYKNETSSTTLIIDANSYCTISESVTCLYENETITLICEETNSSFYLGFSFWTFTILMSLGTIGYNISNCISDAICFDVLGDGSEMKYGRQRVWGTIGFGLSALLGGFLGNYLNPEESRGVIDYFPAFTIGIVCMVIDILCCFKLKLPPMFKSENIVRDIYTLIKQPHIATFLTFAVFVGVCDASVIFYLLWYLEDMAVETGFSTNLKLLEGITVAVETLCGEVVMFSLSGKILSKIGFGYCLSICFAFYTLRLALIAIIPSPWWIIPVEMIMQGPTYALTYTTIVAYASAVAPPGTSATIQGIVAGMDDGLGFSLGSLLGGIIYRIYGGRIMYGLTSIMAFLCCIAHTILFQLYFKHSIDKPSNCSPLKKPVKPLDSATELESTKFIQESNNDII